MRGTVAFACVCALALTPEMLRGEEDPPPEILILDGSDGRRLPEIAKTLAEKGLTKYRVGRAKKPAATDRIFCKVPQRSECRALSQSLRLGEDPSVIDEDHAADIVISLSAQDPAARSAKSGRGRRYSLVDRVVPIVLPRKGFEVEAGYSRILSAATPQEIQGGEGQNPDGAWTTGLRAAAGFGPADVFVWTPLQQGGIEQEGLTEVSSNPNGFAGGGTFSMGVDIGLSGWGEERSRKPPDHAFRGGIIYKLGDKQAMGSRAHPHFQALRGGTTAFFSQEKGIFGGLVGKTGITTPGAKGGAYYGLGYGYDFSEKGTKTQDFQLGGGLFISILNIVAPMLEIGLSGIRSSTKEVNAITTILDFQVMAGFRAFPVRNLFIFASTPLLEFVSLEADFGAQGKFSSEGKEPMSTVVAGIGLRF